LNPTKPWHLENPKEKIIPIDQGISIRQVQLHSEKSDESLISINEGISIRKGEQFIVPTIGAMKHDHHQERTDPSQKSSASASLESERFAEFGFQC
jgi:hypothetical protein